MMKCPKCEEVSTFSHAWTERLNYYAPLTIGDDGEIQVDYDNRKYAGGNNDGDIDECICDKCDSTILIEEIEIVEVEEFLPSKSK